MESEKNEVLLEKQQVWDILEFSRALVGGYFQGVLTPELVNARMKDVSFKPLALTQQQLNDALASPKDSEESLRSFLEYLELVSMPLKRILSYMASHLAMDITYSATNVVKPSDYTKPAFKKDQDILYNFLDNFDYKHAFRNVTKQLLRNELFVATPRENGDSMVLQELPVDYCKITGRWDYGLLVSFNFHYFMQTGIDIDLYPSFFKKKLRKIAKNSDSTNYKPSLNVDSRGNSQWVYWVDLPPDVGWAFKLDTSLITAIPYFAALMPDLIDQGVMRSLQKDVNMASASKMLFGEVPLIRDNKSASVKDMIAIDPRTLGQFLNLVKTSLSSAIKVASAPLENMQAVAFEGDNELYDKYLRTALSSSGMDTSLLYSSQIKANLVDSQLSFQSDSKIMEQQLYPQFNAFLNYFINRRTKKYKYSVELEGNDYYLDRKQRFDSAMTLADKGIVLPQKIAASIGVKPQTLYRWIEEAKETKFVDQLSPILGAFQMAPGGDGAGRPQKSESELKDSGAQTREAGGNVERGGKQ